ncbi:MAG: hypothetical protein GY696_35135 [Gammaproteobacteria bacterium]|nr:hypothetical protein [Gammaproteobacteria bacterium]
MDEPIELEVKLPYLEADELIVLGVLPAILPMYSAFELPDPDRESGFPFCARAL